MCQAQTNPSPQWWRDLLRRCETSTGEGAPIIPRVFARPVTILFSFQGERPFLYMPSFAPLKDLPHVEKLAALHNPDVRRRILADEDPSTAGIQIIYKQESFWRMTFRWVTRSITFQILAITSQRLRSNVAAARVRQFTIDYWKMMAAVS